jgi:hypothetical protein
MNFRQLLADYYLGNKSTSQLPEIALKGIQEGIESDSLLILAGMNGNDNQHEINQYFKHAEIELNIKEFPPLESANILLKFYLNKMVKNPDEAYKLMGKIHNCIYTNFKLEEVITENTKYLGSESDLERMYTWYRELQDWEDGSKLFYYNNLSRPKQRLKFIEELLSEAKKVIAKLNN